LDERIHDRGALHALNFKAQQPEIFHDLRNASRDEAEVLTANELFVTRFSAEVSASPLSTRNHPAVGKK